MTLIVCSMLLGALLFKWAVDLDNWLARREFEKAIRKHRGKT